MDLYTALAPVHFFWKYTGIGVYTLERKTNSPKYVIRKYDDLITYTIIAYVTALNIINVTWGGRFDSISSISDMMKRSSYNIAALSYVITMWYYRNNVMESIANLVLVSTGIEDKLKVHSCHWKTRNQLLIIILTFLGIITVSLISDVFYEGPIGLEYPHLYFIYYYTYYVLTVSTLSMLFFFLIEIRRLLRIINAYFRTDIYKSKSRTTMNKKVLEIERLHRTLRSTCRTVNTIYQVVMLAKVTVTSMFALVAVFRFASNTTNPVRFYIELYTTWSAIHFVEMAVALKLFTDVHRQVNRINLSISGKFVDQIGEKTVR